jgi:hypothetical protein
MFAEPECPGPDCWMCSGAYCETHFNDPCDCDVVARHMRPRGRPRVEIPELVDVSTLEDMAQGRRVRVPVR